MTEKRYAIVRVDGFCPLKLERKLNCDNRLCEDCKLIKNYGDTKEQMILKIAQVLIREVLADIKIKVDKRTLEELTKMQRQSAEKIIEFLGVK